MKKLKESSGYKLIYHSRVLKFLKKIQQKRTQRILGKIKQLCRNPADPYLNIRKLVNTQGSYRLRFGDIRIIYEISISEKRIYIIEIEFRGSVYK